MALAVKREITKRTPASKPIDQQLATKLTEHELFVAQKRQEATLRDITGKAVCAVKRALRQPGAQADGRPAIPADWDQTFKPQLGSFMKFVLGRPDQFRVIEGSGPGFYTVENIAGNKTAVAPSWDKGKGKGKGQGKAFGKGKNGKADNNGNGTPWGNLAKTIPSKGKGSPSPGTAPPKEHKTILPRAARLLAQAAKQELAAEADKEQAPPADGEEQEAVAAEQQEEEFEEQDGDGETWEDGEEQVEPGDAEDGAEQEAEEEADDSGMNTESNKDQDTDMLPKRGSFIQAMLSTSPSVGGVSGRKRPVPP